MDAVPQLAERMLKQSSHDFSSSPQSIWRLTPVHPDGGNLNACTFRGELLIWAAADNDARNIASNSYFIAPRRSLGQDVAVNPWRDPGMVSCEKIDHTGYSLEGSGEILYAEKSHK